MSVLPIDQTPRAEPHHADPIVSHQQPVRARLDVGDVGSWLGCALADYMPNHMPGVLSERDSLGLDFESETLVEAHVGLCIGV